MAGSTSLWDALDPPLKAMFLCDSCDKWIDMKLPLQDSMNIR